MATRKSSPKRKAAPAPVKSRGGRPRKTISREQIEEVRRLARVLTREQIAAFFGMSAVTFYTICQRQPEVSDAYQKGRAEAVGDVGRSLLARALEGDTASAIFYLKTQAGWREQRDVRILEDSSADAAKGKLAALLRLEPDEDAGE